MMQQGLLAHLRKKRVLVASIVLFLLALYGVAGEYVRSRAMGKEISRLAAQATALETKNGEIAERITSGSADAVLEREARLKLNLRKPGEQVVIVRSASSAVGADDTEYAVEKVWNPSKWWRHFFR